MASGSPTTTSATTESGIRITVTPSQSSYFAGEPFEVTVTFTNTHAAAGPSNSLNGIASSTPPRGHKRASHSISSAPIARPPTSPGTPTTRKPPSLSLKTPGKELARHGLIGLKGKNRPKSLAAHLRTDSDDRDDAMRPQSASYAQHVFSLSQSSPSPSRPRFNGGSSPATPLTRSNTLDLASSHPHARKHSLLDGSEMTQVELGQVVATPPPPTVQRKQPSSPLASPQLPQSASSTSSFSLSLDPISESTSPTPSTPGTTLAYPQTPGQVTPLDTPSANSTFAQQQLQTGLGLGFPPPPLPLTPTRSSGPRTANLPMLTTDTSKSELLLYAYAQLNGFFTVSSSGDGGTFVQQPIEESMQHLRKCLLKRKGAGGIVGGGSMDISASLLSSPVSPGGQRRRKSHSRSSSWGGGLMALVGVGGGANPGEDLVDENEQLPTLQSQSSIFGVDLLLSPGESRTYTYTLALPPDLPPTFRGKWFKFGYELVVGVSRAHGGSRGFGGIGGGGTMSRMMKVPIRMYNTVIVNKAPTPYDLSFPLIKHNSFPRSPSATSITSAASAPALYGANDGQGSIVDITASQKLAGIKKRMRTSSMSIIAPSAKMPIGGANAAAEKKQEVEMELRKLREYGKSLVGEARSPSKEFPSPLERGSSMSSGADADVAIMEDELIEMELDQEREKGLGGCREAVEILTRVMKKATYEIAHKGHEIASLTLTKTSYRLGETVHGVIEVNDRKGWGRCSMMSISLESTESLPSSLLTPPSSSPTYHSAPPVPLSSQQQTRIKKTHFTTSTTNTLHSLRIPFSLVIPSDASPGFSVDWTPPLPPLSSNGRPGGQHRRGSASVASFSLPPSGGGIPGGLEWSIKLSLSISTVPPPSTFSDEEQDALEYDVKFRSLERDGVRGGWGSSWRATDLDSRVPGLFAGQGGANGGGTGGGQSWGSWIFGGGSTAEPSDDASDDAMSTIDDDGNHAGNVPGYDGIRPSPGGVGEPINFDGTRIVGGHNVGRKWKWREAKKETVECEVPIRVWPGNTAFKAGDVVFDV
ncbi:Rgp1-domain-containing protein [Flagelloscypha sp. PMI_526]|nr:Rgp1-domain-containing protein [Flagelloscypha sp. PMI_526]